MNTIAREKLAEGVTTLLPTTLTLPEADLAATLKSVAAYDGRGCKLPGVHLEGPFINPKCTGAQNPAFVRKPDVEEVKRLNAIYPVLKVSFAVEEEGGDRLCEELRNLGITPSCVHSAANYSQFKAGYAKGLRNLSHFCNQMTPLHHRDIGLVGARSAERRSFHRIHLRQAAHLAGYDCAGVQGEGCGPHPADFRRDARLGNAERRIYARRPAGDCAGRSRRG